MTSPVVGALAAGTVVAGAVLAVSGWRRGRRPALVDRVSPYLRDVVPPRQDDAGPTFQDRVAAVARRAADMIGSDAGVRRRLDRLGATVTLEAFRARQLRWAAAGLVVAVAVSLLLAARRPVQPWTLLVLCAVATLVAAWWCDHDLSQRVRRREQAMLHEFPTIADMLALAVAAGESPTSAVQRVAQMASGDLGDELRRVLGDVHAGGTIADSFDALASRTGVSSMARFAEAVAAAVERGTPLVDVLHAQAGDVREAARRELIESGGRREVLMMVPVVFAILPVTVIFAFYPGLVGLSLISGS